METDICIHAHRTVAPVEKLRVIHR